MKLQELYSHTSLEQGMIYLADSIKQHNAKFYNQEIETWINQTNYISREQKAIEFKRSGNFTGAINIYNQLFESKPHFSRIHYSAFKTLAAARQIKEAYQAIQLWCLAIVPNVVFENLERFVNPASNTVLCGRRNSELYQHLYLWSATIPEAMYHLGTCKMIIYGMLDEQATRAYFASLAGQIVPILHDMEHAKSLGIHTASELPWLAISNVVDGEVWNYIVSATFYALRYYAY